MNLDDLTLGQIKEISAFCGSNKSAPEQSPFELDKQYLIRTVTHIQTGVCKKVVGSFVFLESAAWIADTGRFSNCLKEGTFNEVEPYPNGVWVNTGSIIDFSYLEGDLPTEQK